jgi:uncharacterized protein (TIGR03118 family)
VLAIAGLGVAGKAVAASDQYVVHPLVSSSAAIPADRPDANLKNAWGLVASPTSPWWTSNNATDTSTILATTGNFTDVGVAGGPTGIVWNGTANVFVVGTRAAAFIFDTEAGTLLGWNGGAAATTTFTAPDGAIYKGLAIATVAGAPELFAADFHNAKIDIFNGQWQPVAAPDAFTDPSLPAGYAPFNVQTIGSRVFVAYAKQDADREDELDGVGAGYVDAYDTSGRLLGRVAAQGPLNAPWGLAQAPAGFGAFGGDLLVGNFGDGRIDAYKETAPNTWTLDGTLKGLDGSPLAIQGLWALEFGNGGANNGPTTTLFFTAGPAAETQGEFGRIQANPLAVGGTVPATLALTLGAPATSFGTFTPGVAMDYTASESADVLSTGGNATLSVADPDATNPGHLVNGTFVLPQPLQADATSPAGTGGAFAPVGGANAPTTLLTYAGPVSHDPAVVNFKQSIAASDPLRTGTYAKTLTFTLSTTQP